MYHFLQYILISIILIFLLLKMYVKIKYKFWAFQPVFHYYNLFYWIYPIGLIKKDLPSINKYCNFLNITTTEFAERKDNELANIIKLIQTYYYRNISNNYIPPLSSFTSHFIGNNKKTFISTYYSFQSQIKTKEVHPELIATLSSKPLNVILFNDLKFSIYYVDNLCVHKQYRNKEIAPQIIQTHLFNQGHNNKKIRVSLFKREGVLTGIVPLTVYKTYQFNIPDIKKIYLPESSMQFIEINKQNLNLLIDYLLLSKDKFKCIIIPDLPNIINLIDQNVYKIYAIIQNQTLLACYFFRESHVFYESDHAVECFASISNTDNHVFISGFTISLYKFSKIMKANRLTIENISANNIIIDYIFSLNTSLKIVNPTAYFFYNYAIRPILSKDVFILS